VSAGRQILFVVSHILTGLSILSHQDERLVRPQKHRVAQIEFRAPSTRIMREIADTLVFRANENAPWGPTGVAIY
jgi:hypothetical protein